MIKIKVFSGNTSLINDKMNNNFNSFETKVNTQYIQFGTYCMTFKTVQFVILTTNTVLKLPNLFVRFEIYCCHVGITMKYLY